jgi:hypothetical protein
LHGRRSISSALQRSTRPGTRSTFQPPIHSVRCLVSFLPSVWVHTALIPILLVCMPRFCFRLDGYFFPVTGIFPNFITLTFHYNPEFSLAASI